MLCDSSPIYLLASYFLQRFQTVIEVHKQNGQGGGDMVVVIILFWKIIFFGLIFRLFI